VVDPVRKSVRIKNIEQIKEYDIETTSLKKRASLVAEKDGIVE
jgi:ribosomal protein L20A (L18A)